MTRYVFDKVRRRASKAAKCPGCGKRLSRSRTFWMSVNPWNKDPETGLTRTEQQIWAALGDEIRAWMAEPVEHEGCGGPR